MALMAMCMPILPGKLEMWKAKMEEIKQDPSFAASREALGVHERTFLQQTPHGDFLILTMEGDNPAEAFGQVMANMPPDFAAFAKEVHGLDASAPPPPLPTLEFDSRA